MKSTAKKKTFVNNMITLGMVAAAWLIMEILMNTGHVSSLLKGLLVPVLDLCDHGSILKPYRRNPR